MSKDLNRRSTACIVLQNIALPVKCTTKMQHNKTTTNYGYCSTLTDNEIHSSAANLYATPVLPRTPLAFLDYSIENTFHIRHPTTSQNAIQVGRVMNISESISNVCISH